MPNPFASIIREHTGVVGITSDPPSGDAELVQEMEEAIAEKLTQKPHLYTPYNIHASQIYKECPRKWWLLKQAGQQHEVMSVGCGLGVCFGIGHALHEMVQDNYFPWYGEKVTLCGNWSCDKCLVTYPKGANKAINFPTAECCGSKHYSFFEPYMKMPMGKLPLVGSCDGVLAVDKKPWAILEIKTANEWSYSKDPETWSWWPSYLWQAHAYMKGFGLDKTVFMIINKAKQGGDTLPIKFKLVEFDKAVWAEVENRVCSLNEIQDGRWDGFKMAKVRKTCKAGSIDKNCPVAVQCAKGAM